MFSGIRFDLNGEYRPMTIATLNPRKCWEHEFQSALREIAGDTYPQADYMLEGADPHVVFSKINFGMDVLKNSKSYDQRRPSTSEVARVQEQIEQIHALANNPNIPMDRREFFRNLQLPNPRYMPECWRTTGFFRKRLHVLWGLTKGGKHSTFLPASGNASDWNDKQDRISLGDALGVPLAVNTGRRGASAGNVGNGTGWGGAADGRNGGFLTWLLNALTFGWYGRRHGCRDGGCLGSIFSWLLRLLLIMSIVSLLRGCVRGCVPRINGGHEGVPASVPGGGRGGDLLGGNHPGAITPPSDTVVGADGITGGVAPDIPPELKNKGDAGAQGNSGEGGEEKKPGGKSGGTSDGGRNDTTPPDTPPPSTRFQEKVSNLDAARALACHFRVNPPKDLPGSNDDVARVEFSVSPIDDIGGKKYEVSDWRVNGDVRNSGASLSFIPEDGLRFDKTYTISATVVMDGSPQRVEPFQWNVVDVPTWQIFEFGRDEKTEMRQYKLVCCNSSSIKPKVKNWKVEFRTKKKGGEKKLDFKVVSNRVGENVFEMRKSIGFFEGAYFMEMTAEIDYEVRGKIKSVTHVETFPFTHDSSADGLTKAKYEVVIPNVYFCLAKLEDGSLINGTAFAISEKLLISNYHVAVGGIPECYANSGNYKVAGPVTLTNVKGKTFHAKVDRFDRGRDLAILRLCDKKGKDTDDRLPGYLHLAEDALVAGISETSARHVFAVGYPKGTICMGPPAFTDGKAEKIIKRDYDWRGQHQAFDTILNYTSTKCGYSGGPLIDYQTEAVLGVNFGGFIENKEGHKAASLATSAVEVRLGFPNLKKK